MPLERRIIIDAQVLGVVGMDGKVLVEDVIDNPDIEPWFLIECAYRTAGVGGSRIITQDAESFHQVTFLEEYPTPGNIKNNRWWSYKPSITFLPEERPIIEKAIKHYVK